MVRRYEVESGMVRHWVVVLYGNGQRQRLVWFKTRAEAFAHIEVYCV